MGRRRLRRVFVLEAASALWNPNTSWDYCWRMRYDWRSLAHEEDRRHRFRQLDQTSVHAITRLLGRPDSLLSDAGSLLGWERKGRLPQRPGSARNNGDDAACHQQ